MLMAAVAGSKRRDLEESPFNTAVPCGHIQNSLFYYFMLRVKSAGPHGEKPEAIKYLQYNNTFIALLHTYHYFPLSYLGGVSGALNFFPISSSQLDFPFC